MANREMAHHEMKPKGIRGYEERKPGRHHLKNLSKQARKNRKRKSKGRR